ncbi:5053_t:CDS:2, partial [Racocetra persica]
MPFNCRVCSKRFITIYGLTQHMNMKHQRGSLRWRVSHVNQHQRSEEPQHDTNLWNTPAVRMERPSMLTEIHTSNTEEDDIEEQGHYNDENFSDMSVEESLNDGFLSMLEDTIQLVID